MYCYRFSTGLPYTKITSVVEGALVLLRWLLRREGLMNCRSSVTKNTCRAFARPCSRPLLGINFFSPFDVVLPTSTPSRLCVALVLCVSFLLGLNSVGERFRQSHVDAGELLREEAHVKIAGRSFSHNVGIANGKGVGKKPDRYNLHTYQLPWYTIELVGVQSIQLLAKIPQDVRDYWCADPSPPILTPIFS